MWQKLAEIINTLVAQYQKLYRLGNEKRGVLVNVDIKSLEKIVHQEEAIVEAINKAEKERQRVINLLTNQDVKIRPDMQMRDVLAQCPDIKLRGTLKQSHDALHDIVKKTQELQSNNEIMISAALDAINFKLNQLGGSSVEPVYGSSGQERVSHEKNFDLEV